MIKLAINDYVEVIEAKHIRDRNTINTVKALEEFKEWF